MFHAFSSVVLGMYSVLQNCLAGEELSYRRPSEPEHLHKDTYHTKLLSNIYLNPMRSHHHKSLEQKEDLEVQLMHPNDPTG